MPQHKKNEEKEASADGCAGSSPSNIYSRYDVIQNRPDLAPSRLRDMKIKEQKEKAKKEKPKKS